MIILAEPWLVLVRDVLRRHLPTTCTVWVFGSRVDGNPKPFSDLDLALIHQTPLPFAMLAALEHDFDESKLPIKVDIVDWQRITPAFRKIIEQKHQVIQSPEETV